MTATDWAPSTSTDVRPLPHRVPLPATEPRYDDEYPYRPPAPTQAALALELPLSATIMPFALTPAPRAEERHLRIVDGYLARFPFDGAHPTATREALPNPKTWTGRYVQALLEVLAGTRPAMQLMRWSAECVYTQITRRVRALVRTAPIPRRGRAVVKSIHVCEPRDGVVEAAVHVRHGGRSRAIALRLEGHDGHWRCTALQLG